MATPRRRLDRVLVERGLAPSGTAARELILEGRVSIGGAPARKPATMVAGTDDVHVAGPPRRWVGRGAEKLEAALDELHVDVTGRTCLDAGASTGGFTQVLLARGAERVHAVDVGYGQLAWAVRTDPRVVVHERTNVRHLGPGSLPGPAPDLVVADLSFIGLGLVLPALAAAAAPAARFVLLVKPQFEVGRDAVGRGGIVRDPAKWRAAVAGVVDAGGEDGLALLGGVVSRTPGQKGNIEFFVHLAAGPSTPVDPVVVLDRMVDDALALAPPASRE